MEGLNKLRSFHRFTPKNKKGNKQQRKAEALIPNNYSNALQMKLKNAKRF